MARFLYLIQGKGTPPNSLWDALPGPDSEVIALSWLRPTRSAIFYPFSTFAKGRNRLYAAGLERGGDFLYFIFVNEDAKLTVGDRMIGRGESPWRVFERYLLEYEPAVGVPWYSEWQRRTSADVDTRMAFDQIITAIHIEALPVLIPYDDRSDAYSWNHPGVIFFQLAALLYPGHTLQFNALEVRNRLHSWYPRCEEFRPLNAEMTAFIRDPGLRGRFRPNPAANQDANGEVTKKNRSYRFSDAELGRMFDLEASFWRRKAENAAFPDRRRPWRLAGLGEQLNKSVGPAFAAILLGPLLLGRELFKTMRYGNLRREPIAVIRRRLSRLERLIRLGK